MMKLKFKAEELPPADRSARHGIARPPVMAASVQHRDGALGAKVMLPTESRPPTTPVFLIGMRGVYLVAAELSRRGFIVSPTSRSAFGADLLVTDQKCKKAWSVQVKTTTRPAKFCLVGKQAKETASDSHIYVFVNVKADPPMFLVVPSGIVAKFTQQQGEKFWIFYHEHAKDYRGEEGWRKVFGAYALPNCAG